MLNHSYFSFPIQYYKENNSSCDIYLFNKYIIFTCYKLMIYSFAKCMKKRKSS